MSLSPRFVYRKELDMEDKLMNIVSQECLERHQHWSRWLPEACT